MVKWSREIEFFNKEMSDTLAVLMSNLTTKEVIFDCKMNTNPTGGKEYPDEDYVEYDENKDMDVFSLQVSSLKIS